MKLAVSNIAWPPEQDEAVAAILVRCGVTGIEVAPTKFWPKPTAATPAEIARARAFWNDRGIEVVAAQALLFGQPELTIFESEALRERTLTYLSEICRACGQLGAGPLVFGSPKNRRIGAMPLAEAQRIAIEFFRRLGELAARAGTCIVLEANPPVYGADFVTRAAEAIALIHEIAHPGLQLHLDTGCMTLAGDPIAETFAAGFPSLRHFHVSEPNLSPPGNSGIVDHAAFAAELHQRGYDGWVSLEMREPAPFTLDGFTAAVYWFTEHYSSPRAAG
jgi:sugar phosphate isomerase/epimerase